MNYLKISFIAFFADAWLISTIPLFRATLGQ